MYSRLAKLIGTARSKEFFRETRETEHNYGIFFLYFRVNDAVHIPRRQNPTAVVSKSSNKAIISHLHFFLYPPAGRRFFLSAAHHIND